MSKSRLVVGDLIGALQMKKADIFKYVLGVDITVLKNMLISTQFIQDRNLDYIDDSTGYTTDYATMHLSNGFQKVEKIKNVIHFFYLSHSVIVNTIAGTILLCLKKMVVNGIA